MNAYDRQKPFVPTVQDPGPVSFSEDAKTWSITRDVFFVSGEGTIQAYITQVAPAGSVLEAAVRTEDGPRGH